VVSIQATALTYLAVVWGGVAAGLAGVAAGAVSRAAPVVVARLAAGQATGTGFGAWFVGHVSRTSVAVAAIGALSAIVALGVVGGADIALGGLAGWGIGVGLGLAIVRLRGQVDGDALGASVELTVAATLVLCVVLGS
jgi:cobalamin synthase